MGTPTEDKEWATKYLLDPLTAPEPSQETGPGSHFRSTATAKPLKPSSSISKTPTAPTTFKTATTHTYPTPPNSASPTASTFHPSNPYSPSYRQVSFNNIPPRTPVGDSTASSSSSPNTHSRHRGSSINERYPGDMSHRPLDQIRREAKAADRAPHLKKKHMPGADIIDSLDRSAPGAAYHHEGPYDATLLARNTSFASSPVEAVRSTNAEALKATPRANIRDALDKHVPLQGTATIPSGMAGIDGVAMRYEEGADLMREPDAEGGAYRRWPDMKYHPEDYKGKGEPSFSIDRAIKKHDAETAASGRSAGNSYEMHAPLKNGVSRQRSVSGSGAADLGPRAYGNGNGNGVRTGEASEVRRSNTTGRKMGDGLKRRFGSLRRSKKDSEV